MHCKVTTGASGGPQGADSSDASSDPQHLEEDGLSKVINETLNKLLSI